jgi:outer membrane lipoprotein-sorting protein
MMKRILLALLILSVLLTGCAQKLTESEDIGIEEVQEDQISQELGQEIEDIETLNESDFGLGSDFDEFESDLEDLEW